MPENERIRVGDHVVIYQRGKKKRWTADFWRMGRHCRQSLRTSNKKIAFQRALQLDAQLAAGVFQPPPPAMTVRQATDSFLAFLETEHRARKTLVKYRGILSTLVLFLEDQSVIRLSQVTTVVFDRFRAFRKADHHPKTMYTEGVVIKQFFRWAKSRRLMLDNPIADVKLRKPKLEPKAGPSLAQVDRILAAAHGVFHALLALLGFTGVRAGELQRLRLEDVDLQDGWLSVVSRPGAETKTRLSRKIPLHPRLRAILAALPRSQGPWFFTAEPSRKYPAGGHWISTKRLNDRFLRLLEGLKIPAGRDSGFTIHSLRHFFETFTINSGVPQRVVDAWQGHRSDRSMAAVYYSLSDADSQTFMNKVPFGAGAPTANVGKEV